MHVYFCLVFVKIINQKKKKKKKEEELRKTLDSKSARETGF